MWRDGVLSGAIPALLAGLAAGAVLGAVYFGALWASIRQLLRPEAGAGFVLALLVRMAVAVGVLALVGRWAGGAGLLGALAGFIVVRAAMLRRLRPDAGQGGPRS
jgi:F1F0 ATPase subunit 2